MNGVGEIISSAIKLALFLAAMEQLKPATLYLVTEIAKAQQKGLVSLSALNKSLGIEDTVSKHKLEKHNAK